MSDAPQPKDTIVTRLLGVMLGIGLMITFVQLAGAMGWAPVVAGILTGLSGAIMGGMGSSFQGRYITAVLGNAGVTNFALGLVMFFAQDRLPFGG
jgi:hypothetical protein